MTRTLAASRKIFLRACEILRRCVSARPRLRATPLRLNSRSSRAGRNYVITRIEFDGNRRIQRDTLLARIFSRRGDPYTREARSPRFSGVVEHAVFRRYPPGSGRRSQISPNGKIVIFYVTERPIIRRIEYKGNKSDHANPTFSTRFKEKKVGLSVESQFDPTKIKRAEVVLKELLAEHGRQFATVKPTYERIAATNAVKLVFNID